MIFLPHTNTVILLEPYWGTITEPGLPVLATDKSRYFAQPRPIIVNYFVYKEQSTISPNHFNSYLEV